MMRGTQVPVHCEIYSFEATQHRLGESRTTKPLHTGLFPFRHIWTYLDIFGRHRDVVERIGYPVELLLK